MEALVEKRKYGSVSDWNAKNENNFNKIYLFVLHQHTDVPSIQGQRFPNSVSLKLIDQIYDPIKRKTRIIQVIPGETSIYKDEQSDEAKNMQPIIKTFTRNGDLVVETRESQTLDFLMNCNWNGSNPNRNKSSEIKFWLIDNKSGIEHEIKKDEAEAEAANWCYKAEFKHIVRYARVLGLDIDVDPDQLRHSLRQIAKRDAQKFNDGLKNKYTQRKFYVLEAVDMGIVSVDLRNNSLSWTNGHLITNSPLGKHPVDHFVDLSMSNTDMDMTYRTIHQQVEPNVAEAAPEVKKTIDPQSPALVTFDVNTPTEKLIEAGVQRGAIVQNHLWFTYAGKKYQKKKLIDTLDQDATIKDALIKALV